MKYHNKKLNSDWLERKSSIPLVHFSQTGTHEFRCYLWWLSHFNLSIFWASQHGNKNNNKKHKKKFLKSIRWECSPASHDGHCSTTRPENISMAILEMILRTAFFVQGIKMINLGSSQ